MKQHVYYTIITGKRSCTVVYATGPTYKVEALVGTFDDPGEASQEIKKSLQGKLEYLTEKAFERKVSELHTRYKQDLAKLADWNIGRTIRI